jgi:hypothetical protein
MRALFIALVISVAGCGARTEGDASTTDLVCASYAAAYRAYDERCPLASDPPFERRWDVREQRLRVACMSMLALANVGVDAHFFERCGAALPTAQCDARVPDLPQRAMELAPTPRLAPIPAACIPPMGRAPDGTGCFEALQCASGVCMRRVGADDRSPACGTCEPRVPAGGICTEHSICAENARCDFSGSPWRCIEVHDTAPIVERRGLGEPCAIGTSCEVDLRCDHSGGTCVRPTLGVDGVPCDGGLRLCAPDYRCMPTNTCAKITWVPPGEACGGARLCERGPCRAGTFTCPRLIADGEPCTVDWHEGVCDLYAQCIDGRCRMRGQLACAR